MRIKIFPDPVIPGTDPRETPHKWFAWHPIFVRKDFFNKNGSYVANRTIMVWLEEIGRKLVIDDIFGNYYSYFLIERNE